MDTRSCDGGLFMAVIIVDESVVMIVWTDTLYTGWIQYVHAPMAWAVSQKKIKGQTDAPFDVPGNNVPS